MTTRILATLALVIAAGAASFAGRTDPAFRVIVNSANPTTALAKDTVSAMFLKTQATWSNGNRVLPVDQRVGNHVRDVFSLAVHSRSATTIKNWWNQQIFAGRGVPPPELATDAKVVAFVSSNPGAIGYVAADAPLGDTHAITVSDGE